ncbi:MAG TPA: HTTM domain-containing protein [Planctomycetota bacterium]|nr:HTTM domain-containing protein [Planctomycetota bacterium]
MSFAPASAWRRFDAWFHAPVPGPRLGAFRALVCGVALYDVLLYAGVVLTDAANVSAGTQGRPWAPLYFFQVLGVGPIGLDAAHALQAVAIVSLVCGALGIASRLSCAVAAIAFYAWTGFAYSFGKPHHDKVALAFALAALPFARVGAAVSIDAVLRRWLRRRRGEPPLEQQLTSGMPIVLTQVTLAIGYCGAGLAKVILGGPEWFNGYTLQGIMLGHDGDWSRAFAQSTFLCQLQSIGVVFVQAAFPVVLVWPRTGWFFLPAATAFHLLTWKTMDTGPYMRVWLLLFAFVPMERIPAALHRGLTGGAVRAAITVLATAGGAALVGVVAGEVMPTWLLLATAAWLLFTFVRHVLRARAPASAAS